jgi:hypothetical protein
MSYALPKKNYLESALSGAATGFSLGGPVGAGIGAGISLIPSIWKGIQGIGQRKAANKINPINPGYEMNRGVIDNARILQERSNNYLMPGYGQAMDNISGTYSNAYNQGVQGASSGGDVLDLAAKLAYGQGQQTNALATLNAQGAEGAKLQSLQANTLAGEEYQAKNAYDRAQYDAKLREKAALLEGGSQNLYGALDIGSSVAGAYLNPKKFVNTTNQNGNNAQQQGSIFV